MVNSCADLRPMMSDMSLLDGKEEKEVSSQEQDEDSFPLPQQALHQSLKSNGHASAQLPDDTPEEQELLELRNKLDHLKRRRRKIQQSTTTECLPQKELLLRRLNAKRRDRTEIIEEYLSAWKGRDFLGIFLESSKRWNVLNDCFPIWIDGKSAFATICGCRLGAEAAPLPNDLLIVASKEQKNTGKWVIAGNHKQQNGSASPQKRSILGLFGNNNNANNDLVTSSEKISEPIKVPWVEINAALGHACLLLKVLQESSGKKSSKGMRFTHELHPMGATSKIGIRFAPTGVLAATAGILNGTSSELDTPPVVYNLFFEEQSGLSFFKKNDRNFHWALQAFLQCIAEAAAQQADKTIAIPHPIQHKKDGIDNRTNVLNGGEWTIGGLSICYPSQQQQQQQNGDKMPRANDTRQAMMEWTRACRYLLTDLKWLVAYAAKHVDR